MRNVLIIVSLILCCNAYSQVLAYESICNNDSYVFFDIDINKDGIKDKVACNRNGNDLIFYVRDDSLYRAVYHGDNYSMDGLYSLVQIEDFTENDNVLYIKNIFHGAGGQTIDYFLSYKDNNWRLSHSMINSSTFDEIKICHIIYLEENRIEECIVCKKNESSIQNQINQELINNINKFSNIITNEFIFSVLKISPLSLKNVISYNNLAFSLEQIGKFNESIYLLKKILDRFPNRTVAYINIGDAYWGLNKIEEAKQAYFKYIELMKRDGKESKIPQRILDRVK